MRSCWCRVWLREIRPHRMRRSSWKIVISKWASERILYLLISVLIDSGLYSHYYYHKWMLRIENNIKYQSVSLTIAWREAWWSACDLISQIARLGSGSLSVLASIECRSPADLAHLCVSTSRPNFWSFLVAGASILRAVLLSHHIVFPVDTIFRLEML